MNTEPVFRSWMNRLDKVVRDMTGESVLDILGDEQRSKQHLDRLLHTHPAIFMVEYALAQVLIEHGIEPDAVLGTSLGEFAAGAVGGVWDAETALQQVIRQAQAVERHCPPGGMIAVLHDAKLYEETPELHQNCELVSVNYQSHFVVAGDGERLQRVGSYLREKRILFQPLPLRYGFHSGAIDAAERPLLDELRTLSYRKPHTPFYSCSSVGRVEQISPRFFWDVARTPIQFSQVIQSMEREQPWQYLDVGPSGTLAGFLKHLLDPASASTAQAIMTPFHRDVKNLEVVKKTVVSHSVQRGRKDQGMIAYVFPGQGAQKIGMGEGLFEEFPEITVQADQILGYSIKELCVQDPNGVLGQTQYTQPALYVVNALSYLKKVKETGRVPDYVAGHSLGEYNALFAAGAFDFATGLRLVKKRGELMAQATGGGMAAVIGLRAEQVEQVLLQHGIDSLDIANHNAPKQIVLAGLQAEIERVKPFFEAAGAMYIPLRVSGAFHSRYMRSSGEEFAKNLDIIPRSKLKIKVIANVSARPYRDGEVETYLVKQISSPVKWTDSIRYLMGCGVEQIEEVGPGRVLTKLVETIRKEAEPLVVREEEEAPRQELATAHRETAVAQSIEERMLATQTAVAQAREDEERAYAASTSGASTNAASTNAVTSNAATTSAVTTYASSTNAAAPQGAGRFSAGTLGDASFRREYNVKYAYAAGAMYRGIASKEMVVRLGKAGLIGFFGAGGLKMPQIAEAIEYIQRELSNGEPYGMNLVHHPVHAHIEESTIDLFLRYGVRAIEASAFMGITPALVRYRAAGLRGAADGTVAVQNRILAKVSRPEVAEAFLSPAPERIVEKMVQEGAITRAQADLLRQVPMADDLTVEADSGGHTDHGVAYVLMPAMLKLREEMQRKHGYQKRVRVGAAGGIGTPEAAAAALLLGADYLVTGSINQCTVEAGTSDAVKDLLARMNVQDTEYAPAGDMFEMGAKVQVLRKGLFFPSRANKLYELYRQHNSIDEIDEKTKAQLQERYFHRSFAEVYEEVKAHYPAREIEMAEQNPKHKMALIFRWYFAYSTRLAMSGNPDHKVDYQVHCGPALGAFNQWVKGTPLEDWRNRHTDLLAEKLMTGTAELLEQRFRALCP